MKSGSPPRGRDRRLDQRDHNNDTGTLVKKDERLAAFYSPLFRAAQLAYISILGAGQDRFQAGRKAGAAAIPAGRCSVSRLYRPARKALHE